MRAVFAGFCAVCVLIASPTYAGEPGVVPRNAEEASLMHMQAVGDRWPERWQGRQHYLFDENSPPETTASGRATDALACADEPVRVRRADGTTGVSRINRCR